MGNILLRFAFNYLAGATESDYSFYLSSSLKKLEVVLRINFQSENCSEACVLMEAGNHSSLIHTSGFSSSTHSWFLLPLHFLGVLLLPWAGSVYKDSAVQCGWCSQGPGRTRCPGRVSSACSGQEVQIQVCVEKGNAWGCSSWSNPAPCRIFPLLFTGERGAGSPFLILTDDENVLSSVPDLGSLQCPERKTELCVGGTAFSGQDPVQWQLPKAIPACLLQNLLTAPAQLCQPSCISTWCILDYI